MVAVVTFTCWIYAIGVYGQERIIEMGLQPMNIKLFKANVLIVGSFFLIALIFSATQRQINSTSNTFEPKDIIFTLAGLYLFFAIFQTIYFTCKTLGKIELRREVSFGDIFPSLILLLFFFVGVWILQPKVNKFIATEQEIFHS